MTPSPAFDPRVVLAMNLVTQPGVYALLIGSGMSTGSGIPTGWGVVEQLVRRVAAGTTDAPPIGDGDWEAWWSANLPGQDLGYSSLLETLGPTQASRSALLADFFEATEEERADNLKVPGPAHTAIASLVARGIIRVIVTTNFDRLIEHALDAAGVRYQVVATDNAVTGMEPLSHAVATIIKLHGDYASLDQRNTVGELSGYPETTSTLLDRIFDEYGLIVSGWSGDWDHALVASLERRASRRYPLVWTSFGSAGNIAQRLTSARSDLLIENTSADDFFPDLVSRVEAIEAMTDVPTSLEVKLGRLRRALPDPVRHLEVRALFETELEALRTWIAGRPSNAPQMNAAQARSELTAIRERFHSLLQLFTQGIALDRDRQHGDLWVWVLQQALDARNGVPTSSFTPWWQVLEHLPAYYLLRAGVLAAGAARHEDVALRLLVEPRWRSMLVQGGIELPAHQVLHDHRVLEKDFWNETFFQSSSRRWLWPASHIAREELSPLAGSLFGPAGAELALDRMEYRLALASALLRPGTGHYYNAAAAEFLTSDSFGQEHLETLPATHDFMVNGDLTAWSGAATPPVESLEEVILTVDERLRALRRNAD
jgi:hypothetical protein